MRKPAAGGGRMRRFGARPRKESGFLRSNLDRQLQKLRLKSRKVQLHHFNASHINGEKHNLSAGAVAKKIAIRQPAAVFFPGIFTLKVCSFQLS
jgi:hypothetical protein